MNEKMMDVMAAIRAMVTPWQTKGQRNMAVRKIMNWLCRLNVKDEITFSEFCNMSRFLNDYAESMEG